MLEKFLYIFFNVMDQMHGCILPFLEDVLHEKHYLVNISCFWSAQFLIRTDFEGLVL